MTVQVPKSQEWCENMTAHVHIRMGTGPHVLVRSEERDKGTQGPTGTLLREREGATAQGPEDSGLDRIRPTARLWGEA